MSTTFCQSKSNANTIERVKAKQAFSQVVFTIKSDSLNIIKRTSRSSTSFDGGVV
jgi:hypothetical protein